MNREVGIRHNNDSSTLPFGFNCCAIGLGGRVFTQPGPKTDLEHKHGLGLVTAIRSGFLLAEEKLLQNLSNRIG